MTGSGHTVLHHYKVNTFGSFGDTLQNVNKFLLELNSRDRLQRSCCLETNYCRDGESFNYF